MRKLTYLVATTLDGVITGPANDNPDFFLLEGPHAEPQMREYPEMVPTHLRAQVGIEDVPHRHFDTVLQGRASYEVGLREGTTNAFRHLRSIVFSTTMVQSPDPSVELVRTDPIAKVRELKQEPGRGIWLCGGGRIAGVLRPEIDELVLKLHPVVAGSGVRLFDGDFAPERWTLTDQRAWDNGVMMLSYARSAT
ncbi:dihydrofolate reductase family protein [Ornithinicoccus hortensis]|uniref:Dihydrofolate reductase n=1 Tax=Ornithinicoccus hortensis TaxID=82346 RepID=A0A542YPU4_9MICO|nr:dihydrofolate reductase family protein [Ornithinicoccus hortensis]TQL50079.1 dihydrofolate reductase [Ornithinicoccus hortensis]